MVIVWEWEEGMERLIGSSAGRGKSIAREKHESFFYTNSMNMVALQYKHDIMTKDTICMNPKIQTVGGENHSQQTPKENVEMIWHHKDIFISQK